MALTESTVNRTNPGSGTTFKTFSGSDGAIAGAVIVDDSANQSMISGNPGYVRFASAQAVTISSGTVTATISGTPTVTISGTPTVSISNAASAAVPSRLYTGSSVETGVAANPLAVRHYTASST